MRLPLSVLALVCAFAFEKGSSVELQGETVQEVIISKLARRAYEEVYSEIKREWGDHPKLFSGQINWNGGAERVITTMLDAVIRQRKLVWSFTGTSVTAGHDNLFEQSYPRVVHRTMGRVVNATGASFEGRNSAMGNNPTHPYANCVEAHAGTDADLVSWEQLMMCAGGSCGQRAAPEVEFFLRKALVLPKQPAVLVLANVASGDGCSNRPVHSLDSALGKCPGFGPDKNLMQVYGKYGLHSFNPEEVLKRSGACSNHKLSFNWLVKTGKEGMGHGAPWHPGPHGHALAGAMLSVHYLGLFLLALDRLDAAAPGLTREALAEPGRQDALLAALGLPLPPLPLPPPALCGKFTGCQHPEAERCATAFAPTFEPGLDLKGMVSSPLRPPQRTLEPPSGGVENQWAVVLSEEKLLTIPDPKKVYPVDQKYTIVGKKSSGPLDFSFAVSVRAGPVGLCKPHLVSRVAFRDGSAVRFEIDGTATSVKGPFDRPSGGQCVWLKAEVGVGNHTLRVIPSSTWQYVGISQFFFPA